MRATETFYANLEYCSLRDLADLMEIENRQAHSDAWDDMIEDKNPDFAGLEKMTQLISELRKNTKGGVK